MQIEVQNAHLTQQKQSIEQLRSDLGTANQSLAELSETDLGSKILLL